MVFYELRTDSTWLITLLCFDYVLNSVKHAESDYQEMLEKVSGGDSDTDDEGNEDGEGDCDDEGDDDAIEALEIIKPHYSNYPASKAADEPKPEDKNHPPWESKSLRYLNTQWIEHDLQATASIVENVGLEDVFWVLGSKERVKWSPSYSKLLPDLEPWHQFDYDFTALHVAAYFGYVPLADLLLKTGTHEEVIHTIDSEGFQPLYWACRRGYMNMVQKLHDVLAEINAKENGKDGGLTALHAAAWSGNSEIVQYLLKHEAEIDDPNEECGTALIGIPNLARRPS